MRDKCEVQPAGGSGESGAYRRGHGLFPSFSFYSSKAKTSSSSYGTRHIERRMEKLCRVSHSIELVPLSMDVLTFSNFRHNEDNLETTDRSNLPSCLHACHLLDNLLGIWNNTVDDNYHRHTLLHSFAFYHPKPKFLVFPAVQVG
jgi:hypothetical protein